MNIQTERLENQTARFTVEVAPERLERAKQTAARRIAQRVNIPGFRRGKAPYRILVQNGLEGQIVMDAVEALSQEVYRETLEQSDVEPYGPGAFEDYKEEPTPTFIYTVPLQPTIELNDYRSVRLDFEQPEVDDAAVDEAMKQLQQQEALVEESTQPAALGHRVTIDIHSEFADDPPEVEAPTDVETTEEESEGEEADEVDAPAAPLKGAAFAHEHDAQIMLDAEEEPILPGFKAELIGASAGDEREFELTVPEDDEKYEEIAGRKVHFKVKIKSVETITLPPLNDDLAARITQDEEKPLTLLELRMRMRESLQKELERRVKDTYATQVLGEIAAQATISYPEAMVDDQIEAMINDLDSRLRQQGVSLDMYMRVTGATRETLAEQYREQAEDIIKRSLVLRELVAVENIEVAESQLEERINEMLERFGEQAEAVRPMFDTPNMRAAMRNDLLQERVLDRVVAIARGEEIPEPDVVAPAVETVEIEEAVVDEVSETGADASGDVEEPAETDES